MELPSANKNMQKTLDQAKEKMNKALDALSHNLGQIRTGRANPKMLDGIEVEYYGCPTPMNQLGSISVVEGTQLVIKPYDRSILKGIEKAIQAANIGITPQNDGEVVRLNVPKLTGDTRKELAKQASKTGEEAKVAIRNIRRDANDAIKKNKELTEDEVKKGNEKVQKLTDEFIKKIDDAVKAKSEEIMSI